MTSFRIFGHEHHRHNSPWSEAPLWAIELRAVLEQTLSNQETMMAAIDDLKAEVANNTTVEQSAIALLNNLSTMLAAAIASGNMSEVQVVLDQLKANDAELAAAVAANTPAAPAP